MNFFDDIHFSFSASLENCVAKVDKVMPNFNAINYLYRGKIYFGMNHGRQEVLEGPTAFWTWTENNYQYGNIPGEKWVHRYICFGGPRSKRYMNSGLFEKSLNPYCKIKQSLEFEETIQELIELNEKNHPQKHWQKVLLLEKILVMIYQNLYKHEYEPIEDQLISSIERIRKNPKLIDLEKEAKNLNISYSYYRLLFKKIMGCPPYDFLLKSKMTLAAKMIEKKQKNITQIAQELGYDHLGQFSRLFKQKTGVSPREYKNSLPT